MFDDQDRVYFKKRADEAGALAERAEDSAVRRVHLDMAEEYDRRAQGLEPRVVHRPPQ